MTCTALFVGGPYFDVRTDGSRFWNLAPKELTARWEDGRFERYRIEASLAGPGIDGPSLPAIARSLRPSLWNRMFGAAFAHDPAFNNTLLRWDLPSGQWVLANLSEEEANELIVALMFIEATTEAERSIVFHALQMFGKKDFDEDRAM